MIAVTAAVHLAVVDVPASVTDTVISGPLLLAGLLAVAAGFISFASPCVIPLVPGYVSYLAGLVGAETSASDGKRVQWRAVGATGLFVLGFSVVFIAESALVLGVYTSLIANQELLTRIAGVVSIVMGCVLLLPALQREWRPGLERGFKSDASATRRGRLWGAPVLGAAFGTGWLACTSPTLAGIIALSTATEWNGSAVRGLALVILYCAGLGIPFLLLAIGFGWAGTAVGFLRRHARVIQLCGAVLLIVIGIAMLAGLWTALLSPLRGAALLL